MSDRYAATIWFLASALEDAEIKAVLEKEGVKFDPLRGSDWDIEVEVEAGIFHMYGPEASWGQFEELESLLKSKGIPFDRESGQAFDYIPERVIFRPARDEKPVQDLTFLLMNGEPALTVKEIRDLLPAEGCEALRVYLDGRFPVYPPLSEYVKEG